MQVFDTEPTDAQLAVFMKPECGSINAINVRTVEQPGRLIVQPRAVPLWFLMPWILLPLVVYIGYLVYRAGQQALRPLNFVGLVIGCLAAPLLIALCAWINRQVLSQGDFFVLDRDARILSLPRVGVQFQAGEIRGFVEVHGWYRVHSRRASYEWLGELSVLVRTEGGALAHYPVLTCRNTRAVTRLATLLATFFGVEQRRLKVDWKAQKRQQAEDAGQEEG